MSGIYEFGFDDPFSRVVLLGEAEFVRLIILLGVLLRRELLSQVINGAALASIRAAVGATEIGFIAASVGRFDIDVPRFMLSVPATGVAERLYRDGAVLLMDLFGDEKQAVTGRLRFRFPFGAGAVLQAPRFCSAIDARSLRAWVVEALVPRILPAWMPLFS
ncbi:hypothetical protein WJ62_11985 [Burkholderia diffusa]|nr:hypothetical protein WJ62_11985 [Burkholderia diffusa]